MRALADIDAVEKRMGAVRAVRQVVHAIWATARAQLPFVEEAAAEASQYLDWVDEVVDRLAGPPKPWADEGALVIVVGPERPYCGSLHRQILAGVPPEAAVALVGTRLVEAAEANDAVTARLAFSVAGSVTHEDHEDVARSVAARVLSHARDRRVDLLYPRSGNSGLVRIALLSGEREPNPSPPETLSPVEAVLGRAVFEAVTGRIVVALAEALRAEVRARVAAADRARQACDRRIESLESAWRVLRQERITSEIVEIVAATEAAQTRPVSTTP